MAEQIECTPVDLTDKQRANLAKLAAYLRALPADYQDFDMADFASDGVDTPHRTKCGTAACAVGHAPRAGIRPRKSDADWFDYSYRTLIPDGPGWEWAFGSNWSSGDPSPHGAAARIDFLLQHGVPHNQREQRRRRAPLCYSTDRAPS